MSTKIKPSDADLVAHWIEANPHKPGVADMCIRGRAVAVWAIVEQLVLELVQDNPWVARRLPDVELPHSLTEAVAKAYDVEADAVRAAFAYYHRYPDAIEARILLNRSAPEE